jgi:uncharacterized membrane protein YfcA
VSGILIFISGTLLTGAGLGGGAVFVSILMSIMRMTAHEAIPNSKFIIFLSAIVTFVLNTVKAHRGDLIDFTIVRAIVPMSLAGTMLGILINTSASEQVLLILLCCLMGALVLVTGRLAYIKIKEYQKSCVSPDPGFVVTTPNTFGNPSPVQIEPTTPDLIEMKHFSMRDKRNGLLFSLVPVVIAAGIISETSAVPSGVRWAFFGLAIAACLGCTVVFYFWDAENRPPIVFPLVGLAGGICSSLFGIGGGLITVPFLLHIGIDSEVAVAISSTCVLLASASTSLQYLFIGRVAVLVGLFLAVFGIASSISAAYTTRFLMRVAKRPYLIHVIVACAVSLSAIVTVVETAVEFKNN